MFFISHIHTGIFAGGISQASCQPCTGGYYCETPGLAEPTGPCSAGFYCPGEQNITTFQPDGLDCPAGYRCPEGSEQPIPCAAGRSQPRRGQSECEPCPAGYYCQDSQEPEPEPCTPYHYCPEGECMMVHL